MAEEEDNECQELCQKLQIVSIDMKFTEEEYYPKDSFDRYGDDLCEEILSYLSLEDCFRFECLSKQWQRLVFKSQVCLNVDEVVRKLIIRIDIKSRSEWFAKINWEALESMGKKLPNITSIDININLLSSIVTENNEILLKNLTHFRYPYETSDGNLLPAFVDHYKNSLKSFSIVFNWDLMSAEEYIHVLSLTSQMKGMRELSVPLNGTNVWEHNINSHTIHSIVHYHCEEFVNQWPHLKRYRLHLLCKTDPQVRRVYESANRMIGLRRLEFMFETPLDLIGHKVLVTPKSLSPLKRLTHLSICLRNGVLDETLLDSIDTHYVLSRTHTELNKD
ncbi:unnamed protein product [Oppiella nova]|uniref:F-box domain-containing protein n=1 Tax=Oppiella nova TaxID=334625 RepID=A0A7R9LAY4_9ACAR|nr:unnamed protein product [Oppiella nova]CAG2161738.1 unnamed protein product [Oppiella nova]